MNLKYIQFQFYRRPLYIMLQFARQHAVFVKVLLICPFVLMCVHRGLASSSAPLGSLESDRSVAMKCASKDNTNKARPVKGGNHELPTPLYMDDTPYLINPGSRLCPSMTHLLVAVHSKPSHFVRRQAIRRTWGSLGRVYSYNIAVVFFLGNPLDDALQTDILKESTIMGDIVQRDFMESYRNMTRKHLVVLEWTAVHCSSSTSYLLKVDDDTFVDVFHVARMLDTFDLSQVFYCTNTRGAKPQRSTANLHLRKWMVTMSEFAGKEYPAYCEGFAYIMPVKYARMLAVCARYSDFFWIDDVYVTGVLAEKLAIERVGFYAGHSYAYMLPSYASERILDFMFLDARYNEFMPLVWTHFWRAVLEFSMIL